MVLTIRGNDPVLRQGKRVVRQRKAANAYPQEHMLRPWL